jgi:predicted transcriptional regulator
MLILRKSDTNQNYTKEFDAYIKENTDRFLEVKAVREIIGMWAKEKVFSVKEVLRTTPFSLVTILSQ